MKIKSVLVVATLLLSGEFNQATAQVKNQNQKLPTPIIDVHFHTFKISPGEKMDYLDVFAPKSQAQYATLQANDPSLDPLYSLAEEMDIPVGIHMGPGPMGSAYIPMFSGFRISLTHPFYLEDVLIKHPKLRLYVMHAGYPMIDEMLGMMYDFPQLYVGIAAIDWIFSNRKECYRYLKILIDAGYEKRILFGSDEMNWPQGIDLAIKNVQETPFLTEAQKRDIFFNNAVRFFKFNSKNFK